MVGCPPIWAGWVCEIDLGLCAVFVVSSGKSRGETGLSVVEEVCEGCGVVKGGEWRVKV